MSRSLYYSEQEEIQAERLARACRVCDAPGRLLPGKPAAGKRKSFSALPYMQKMVIVHLTSLDMLLNTYYSSQRKERACSNSCGMKLVLCASAVLARHTASKDNTDVK